MRGTSASQILFLVLLCPLWKLDLVEANRKSYIQDAFSFVKLGALSDNHGYFSCGTNKKTQQACQLKCDAGYTLSLTQKDTTKYESLSERGTYTCIKKTGMPLAWYPEIVYDCVEIVIPSALQYFFYLKIPMTPYHCFTRQKDQLQTNFLYDVQHTSHTNRLCLARNLTCDWQVYVGCVNTVWLVDVVLSTNYSREMYETDSSVLSRELVKDLRIFSIRGQSGGPTKRGRRAFRILCAKGTKLEQDGVCRTSSPEVYRNQPNGCPPGQYLDETKMECKLCPKRYYQDLGLQTVCKPCPPGTPGSSVGGQHITSCFSIVQLTQGTDLLTATAFISTVVVVISVLLTYRYRIQDEEFDEGLDKMSMEANNERRLMWLDNMDDSETDTPDIRGSDVDEPLNPASKGGTGRSKDLKAPTIKQQGLSAGLRRSTLQPHNYEQVILKLEERSSKYGHLTRTSSTTEESTWTNSSY